MSPLKFEDKSARGRGKTISACTPDSKESPAISLPLDSGTGLRLLVYSHDTFGLGHLQRCLKISRALMARFPRLAVLIATGSPVVHRYNLPPGVDYVKLPAVRKIGPEEYEARILATSYERIIAVRTSILTALVKEFQPHALLVDHSPTGMNGEMLPALSWLKQELPSCVKIIGLRDILDDPQAVQASWHRSGVYGVLEDLYDEVFVYGSQNLFDTATEYNFSDTVREKTTFCNYIRETQLETNGTRRSNRRAGSRPKVVVTIGGGDGGGETVIGNYLDMIKKYQQHIDFDSTILTGPFLPEDLSRQFEETARGLPVVLKNFVASTTPYFRSSDLIISTAGYNSIAQILEAGRRALIIPRILHRDEQLIRARCLANLGVVTFLHPEQVTAETLYAEVSSLLHSAKEPLTEARACSLIRLDGADNIVARFESIFSSIANTEVSHA